jgi:serine/threonine protein kinase
MNMAAFAQLVCRDEAWSSWPPPPHPQTLLWGGVLQVRIHQAGRGDMGCVTTVESAEGHRVALKYTHFSGEMQEDAESMLRQETRLANAMTQLVVNLGVTPHVIAMYCSGVIKGRQVMALETWAAHSDFVWIYRNIEDEMWLDVTRQALFQVIFTLACLQQLFPGFRHNDLKADNVLLVPATGTRSYTLLGRHFVMRDPRVDVKIIDFGCSHANIPSLSNALVVEGAYTDHGIGPNPCAMYDVHLLLWGLFKRIGRIVHPDARVNEVSQFISRTLPPHLRDSASMIAPDNGMPRLTFEAQSASEASRPKDALLQVLADPFFSLFQSSPAYASSPEYGVRMDADL